MFHSERRFSNISTSLPPPPTLKMEFLIISLAHFNMYLYNAELSLIYSLTEISAKA